MQKRTGCAVITGASSGIGRELAIQFAKEGFPLVLVARRRDRLERLASELEHLYHTQSTIIEADLEKIPDCRKIFDVLGSHRLSVFVNNAGFGECGRFLETDLDKELSMIGVNVRALHFLTKLALQKMEKQGGGYILNVASAAGLMPAGPYMAAYYATKAYAASLTRAVARELKEHGSRVYIGCLCPGPVDTEFDEVANVRFALKGISARECAAYAVGQMKRRKVVIIPTFMMKAAMFFGRFLSQGCYIAIAAHQQKRKFVN